MPNSDAWQTSSKKEEAIKFQTSAQVHSASGLVKVGVSEESTMFCTKMGAFIE
jgi:hypothetical protein